MAAAVILALAPICSAVLAIAFAAASRTAPARVRRQPPDPAFQRRRIS